MRVPGPLAVSHVTVQPQSPGTESKLLRWLPAKNCCWTVRLISGGVRLSGIDDAGSPKPPGGGMYFDINNAAKSAARLSTLSHGPGVVPHAVSGAGT